MENTFTSFEINIMPRHLFVKSPRDAKKLNTEAKNQNRLATLYKETGSIELPIGNMLLSVCLREIA